MAEGVLFNLAEGMIERLASRGFQEIGLFWGVNKELDKLKETVARFQAVLLDAEPKKANAEIKLWLQSVEDAVYEADDVLDEFYTEARWRQTMPGNNKVLKQVRIFFSSSNQLAFGLKMGHKIKDINQRLNEISSNRTFSLDVNREDTQFKIRERVNHSFVLEEHIVGREKDKSAIIQLLLDPISTENVSTISIVGIGGLGKTALTQLVYNDKEVQNHFELKMWVCVSNEFDLKNLVEKIIESATHKKPEVSSMDQLQITLRQKINGRRYLLVLDDVWNEDGGKWLSLKTLLMGGADGSRILITTRSEKVATKSNTSKLHTLRGLDEEQSWFLFKKMAFKDGIEPGNSRIKAAGEEIARKCRGVPLALRTIGGMLRDNHEETEWLDFKNKKLSTISQKENDILPTLKLSYDILPSHLKHCFAYCSLFPPDYEISVKRLIELWAAQGFIKPSTKNECLEDVGYKYYNELLWRSFFQEEAKDEFGMIKSCKMHDLMNELAVLVSGVESTILDPEPKNFDGKCRHVSFNFGVTSSKCEIPISLLKASKIRTFLFLRQTPYWKKSRDKSFCAMIASNFKSMRVLSLNRLRIETLPKCLTKMKHLRYLDLSGNPIKRLPNWVVRLQNLEKLDLSECWNLVELPRDIEKLINLRHLDLSGRNKLAQIPLGLGKLTCLRTLGLFVLSNEDNSSMWSKEKSAGLRELGMLKGLRGTLTIRHLSHHKDGVRESNDGVPLKEKQHLSSLFLEWTRGEDVSGDDENDIIMSMEALQPHPNLKMLYVEGYKGVRLASWLLSLTSIVALELDSCNRCQHLPPLDHLSSLKSLQLYGFENLEYISDEDRGSSMSDEMMVSASSSTSSVTPFFISLTHLSLVHCPKLKGWWKRVLQEGSFFPKSSFPCLSKLVISKCPELTSMPVYPNVEEIKLVNTSWKVLPSSSFVTGGWGGGASDLKKLKSLLFCGIEDLECVPEVICNLISLQELRIENCRNLEYISDEDRHRSMSDEMMVSASSSTSSVTPFFISLRKLSLNRCPKLKGWWRRVLQEGSFFPKPSFPCLSKLVISKCPELTSMPLYPNVEEIELENTSWKVLPSSFVTGGWGGGASDLKKLKSLLSRGIEDLECVPEGICELISLQELRIQDFPNLASLPEGICNLTSLKKLSILECPSLASLPQGIGNLTSLQQLGIEGFPNLASLPQGIGNLTSLQQLGIEGFPNLTSLPQWIGNLTSLQSLTIRNCSNLASLPEGIRGLTSLQELTISNCPILQRRCKKQTGEDWPKIAHIPWISIPEPEDVTPSQPKIWSSLKTLMLCDSVRS